MRSNLALSLVFLVSMVAGGQEARGQADAEKDAEPEAPEQPGATAEPESGAAATQPSRSASYATRLYEVGDWAEARAAFVALYEADPDPEYLFFIADTHRREGHHRQALLYYHRYLESVGGADLQARDAEALADHLHRAIAERNFEPDWAERRRAAAARPRERLVPGDQVGSDTLDPWSRQQHDRRAGSDPPWRDAFWISLGATGAAAAAFVYSGHRVRHYEDKKDQALFDGIQDGVVFDPVDACASAAGGGDLHAQRVQAACDSGKRWATTANVFLVTTAVTAGVSGYFGYRAFAGGSSPDARSARASSRKVEPMIGPGAAAVRVRF